MKTISIKADDLKKFGRTERYFLENPLENFSDTDLILEGTFTEECFEDLLKYLQDRQLRFNSVTFSSKLDSIPYCTDYLPAVNLIIPEGITQIKNFTFLKSEIETLKLPSTLTQIGEKAFVNCSIKKIRLSEKNLYFSLCDGVLKNSLTKQIILRTKNSQSCDSSCNSEGKIWKRLSERKCLSIKAAVYWKEYYEKIKHSLLQKKLLVSVNTRLDPKTQLKMLLQILPDSFGNLMKLPARGLEDNLFPYLLTLQYITEGKQCRFYPDQSTNFHSFFDPVSTVYCYESTLLGPEKITVLFNHIDNGFELIIPKLQVFIYFNENDLTLIPAFILNLQDSLAGELETLLSLDENLIENSQNSTDSISQNSRQNVLSKLTLFQSQT